MKERERKGRNNKTNVKQLIMRIENELGEREKMKEIERKMNKTDKKNKRGVKKKKLKSYNGFSVGLDSVHCDRTVKRTSSSGE